MSFDPYSRTNRLLVDAAIIGASFFLAYLLRYEGSIPPDYQLQMWVWLVPVMGGRLLTGYLAGLQRVQWRYISIPDAVRLAGAQLAFSLVLLLLRFGLPESAALIRLPGSVIAIELVLSTQGALVVRLLRRYLYERQQHSDRPAEAHPRRLLLIGAGILGSTVAKEMASRQGIKVVGFLDDDPRKLGTIVAGTPVLAPTSRLLEIVEKHKVNDVLVCIAPSSRTSFNRLLALLENLPIRSKFIPTIEEILNAESSIQVVSGKPAAESNGAVPCKAPVAEARSTLCGKTILITGGAGFIGSSLAERLADANEVILLDRHFRNQPVSFTGLLVHPNVRCLEADILDETVLRHVAREADLVVHTAAILGVGRVCSNPRETLETNFVGTSRLLQAVEHSPRLERLVYFSTSEVFGVNSFRVQESTPAAVGPAAEARWSYAISKLAGEHLVKAYHRQNGLPAVTVRPFNIFGPRRLGAHAVRHFVLCALTGQPLEVHGDGSQIRSWCYIEDFCDALVEMLARREAIGEDFNIGNPRNTLTIHQLAERIAELTGAAAPIVFTETAIPDIGIRVPSLEKARRILGYQPRYDLDRALRLTIDWYRENLAALAKEPSPAAVSA